MGIYGRWCGIRILLICRGKGGWVVGEGLEEKGEWGGGVRNMKKDVFSICTKGISY